MNESLTLQMAIDALVEGKKQTQMREHVMDICRRYLLDSGQGKKLVETPEEVVAYVVSRMPATYCAILSVLKILCDSYQGEIKTLLDIGSGTGAVGWAADEMFTLSQITCIEREAHMIEIAKELMKVGSEEFHQMARNQVTWIQASATTEFELPQFDLVTASYIMNELSDLEKQKFLEHMWEHSNDVIVIIEPGTTIGYHNILLAREYFLSKGASIIAPCCHSGACEMGKDNRCHFSCRVERSRLQKFVKNGNAPYEDERYSYLIVTKQTYEKSGKNRILTHPNVNKGYVELKVCSEDGIKEVRILARQKEAYKAARKAKVGDLVDI